MITVSQRILVGLAITFSGYHLVLGAYSLVVPPSPPPGSIIPAIVAMALYVIATVASLWRVAGRPMGAGLAAFNLGVAVIVPLLVTSELDPRGGDLGYATWYVAAVGTLLTIMAARRQLLMAWTGCAFLVVQTLIWAGLPALVTLGVLGSVIWVAMAHVLTRALTKAARDARQFAVAEREASQWQAAQDAHHNERTVRLGQTYRMAAPMLRRIAESGGELSEAERRECRNLEAAIRDEIRGRSLLDDAVRAEVMAARRRGSIVTLLDEGGLDDLNSSQMRRIHARLAEALAGASAERIIVRTVPADSDTAVTVVGLSAATVSAAALGLDGDEEVALWLEIPRDVREERRTPV